MKETGDRDSMGESSQANSNVVRDKPCQVARVYAQIPLLICATQEGGSRRFYAECRTIHVCPEGGLLTLERKLVSGQSLLLINPRSEKQIVCQIIAANPNENGLNEIEFKFSEKSVGFWDVDFAAKEEKSGIGDRFDAPTTPDDDQSIANVGGCGPTEHGGASCVVAEIPQTPPIVDAKSATETEPQMPPPQRNQAALQASNSAPGQDRVLRRARRGPRIPHNTRVLVSFPGEASYEECMTIQVGERGALLSIQRKVSLGQSVLLTNPVSLQQIAATVRYRKEVNQANSHIGVEFESASSEFWGIPIPSGDADASVAEREQKEARPENRFRPDAGRELVETAALGSRRSAQGANLPVAPGWEEPESALKEFVKRRGVFVWPALALTLVFALIFLSKLQHRKHALAAPDSAANSLLQEITPDQARLIPETEDYRLARTEDFNPGAVSWLASAGQHVSGKIDGVFSAFGVSSAYVLIGKNKLRRVVILANGELRCDVKYRTIAIVARVPRELIGGIVWDSPPPADAEGDGLLVVRSANDPGSGDILFLRGNAVVSGTPANYQQVALIPLH